MKRRWKVRANERVSKKFLKGREKKTSGEVNLPQHQFTQNLSTITDNQFLLIIPFLKGHSHERV
jgi:hypothetical protein